MAIKKAKKESLYGKITKRSLLKPLYITNFISFWFILSYLQNKQICTHVHVHTYSYFYVLFHLNGSIPLHIVLLYICKSFIAFTMDLFALSTMFDI